ncbi:7555_t:CDS:2 [Paraglomus occultum]|uniref:7555_t:CDS:1 n=1 Tax=Paraglomus occultum TaxID=144539 RepID=A0A9N9CKS3_9GLOM|nr:7555_t:CDS:2 [Paraglomus occultum]
MSTTATATSTPSNFVNILFFDIHNFLNATLAGVCFTECEFDKWIIARPTFTSLIYVILIILYLCVAIFHYPTYRRKRNRTRRNARTMPSTHTSQNPLAYVIVFPFALIYVSLRIAWEIYQQCVFYSLDMLEFVIKSVPRGLKVLWRNCLSIVIKTIARGTWYIIRSIVRTGWKLLKFGYDATRKTCAYSWNTFKRSSVFVWKNGGQRLLFSIFINPIKWAIRRGIYLSRIVCHVACFLIRDMLEDARDLILLGCDSSRWIWNYTIVPTGNAVYHAIVYSRKIVYKRMVIAGTSELTWIVSEALRDPIVRYVIETGYGTIRRVKVFLSSMAIFMKQRATQGLYFMKQLLSQALYFALYFMKQVLLQTLYFLKQHGPQGLYSLKQHTSQAVYTAVSSLCELFVAGLWSYNNILVPLIQIIPATLDLMLQFAYTLYVALQTLLEWVYLGLVRPCSSALFTLAQFASELYGICETVVVGSVAAVTGAVDNTVVAVGDAMMEWVKKEQELREAIRGR